MVACGAYPAQREADEFFSRISGRSTYSFLRELFDAEVLAADGRRDVTTLKDMERPDGIVTVCFRKPNGRVYVAAFARRSNGPYVEGVQLDLAFNGRVTAVDEMTGKPLDTPVEVQHVGPSLRLKNVRVPYLNSRYSQRLTTPCKCRCSALTRRRNRTGSDELRLLSKGGILPDHVHLALGCDVREPPCQVALSYMNNLAYAFGMKRAFAIGFYVGTRGEYDVGVAAR